MSETANDNAVRLMPHVWHDMKLLPDDWREMPSTYYLFWNPCDGAHLINTGFDFEFVDMIAEEIQSEKSPFTRFMKIERPE